MTVSEARDTREATVVGGNSVGGCRGMNFFQPGVEKDQHPWNELMLKLMKTDEFDRLCSMIFFDIFCMSKKNLPDRTFLRL